MPSACARKRIASFAKRSSRTSLCWKRRRSFTAAPMLSSDESMHLGNRGCNYFRDKMAIPPGGSKGGSVVHREISGIRIIAANLFDRMTPAYLPVASEGDFRRPDCTPGTAFRHHRIRRHGHHPTAYRGDPRRPKKCRGIYCSPFASLTAGLGQSSKKIRLSDVAVYVFLFGASPHDFQRIIR